MFYRLQPILSPVINWYYSKDRIVRKQGLRLRLRPSVFHPSLYHSTDVLLRCIEGYAIEGKKLLELGAGSGFISLYLAKHYEVRMVASDVNAEAVAGLRINAKENGVAVEVLESDLFKNIPQQFFDFLLINPPYYSEDPKTKTELAFFAGSDLNYFVRLFNEVTDYTADYSQILMVLSENVPLAEIEKLAAERALYFEPCHHEIIWGERFTVYQIV